MTRPAHLPAPSWAGVPTHFTREEAREWKTWLEDEKGTDINKGCFTCSGPTSFGGRPNDIDELYERMVKRGIVAAPDAPKKKRKRR